MKGIMVFDNMNDLAFIDVDEELEMHIQKLALKDGLLDRSFVEYQDQKIDKNVVMQLFSPLIASYKVMQGQFGNKYKYIESEDGVLLVFDEILNYIAISVCNKVESLDEIKQELSLFHLFVEMLFGPALQMIKSQDSSGSFNISRSDFLARIISKWRTLKMQQQIFLVEAVERLIINQDITAMCIDLLQEILEKVRNTHKDGTYSHAFALVDSKLLALYSSRNSGQLPKEILLLLILVVQVIRSSSSASKQENSEQMHDDEFFVPISSTHLNSKQSRDDNRLNLLKEGSQLKSSRSRKKSENNDEKSEKLKLGAHSLMIYLKSHSGCLVPHIVYVIEVSQKISLVLLNELTVYGTTSNSIQSLSSQLNNLLYHPRSRKPVGSFANLEAEFRLLIDAVWKIKVIEEKEKNLKKLISKWEQLKQYELEEFLKMPKDKTINHQLESGLSSCCELLKNVFEDSVANPCLKYEQKTQSSEYQEVLKLIQRVSIRKLIDFADFLEVKAVQNITMASYITEYPGLIHFIYVDRNSDCLIAPNVVVKKGHLNGTTSLKQKIWRMVSVGRKYIDGINKFCSLWKYDDLYFFYHIWFEDSTGGVIKPTSYPSLKKFPKKGILCGNFFKKLVQECFPTASHDHISCYEFFCVHLETTPTEKIIENSQKLCTQLWDFSGAYRTSLDLL